MGTTPLSAALLDSRTIRCGAVEVRHRTPILALARRLLADGADRAAVLTVRWAATGTPSVAMSLGNLAALDVFEADAGGRGFRRWVPDTRFSISGASPDAPNAADGAEIPAEAETALASAYA